jgi:hypothetical protein
MKPHYYYRSGFIFLLLTLLNSVTSNYRGIVWLLFENIFDVWI